MRNCSKGKSCGATCIERVDRCLLELPAPVSRQIDKIVAWIPGTFDQLNAPDPTGTRGQLGVRPKVQGKGALEMEGRKKAESTFRDLNERKGQWIEVDGKAAAKSVNWEVGLAPKSEFVASGSSGAFLIVKGKDIGAPSVKEKIGIKYGRVGSNEVEVIKRVGEADLGPKLIASRTSNFFQAGVAPGVVAMTVVRGKVFRLAPVEVKGVSKVDAYWTARAALNRLGIAHNDPHAGNIIIDPSSGKARFVDFGLSKIGFKQALAEAIGGPSGSDHYSSTHAEYGGSVSKPDKRSPVFMQMERNWLTLQKKMKEDGFDDREIGKISRTVAMSATPETYRGLGWGKITPEIAETYLRVILQDIP